MGNNVRRTVVVSAVNIRKAGTLEILRSCLGYLSGLTDQYRIVALVHNRSLCDFPGIEYIEMPECVRSWWKRLRAEYFTMHHISRQLAAQDGGRKVWMWLSLHDTTPRVEAEHQEVYCHNAFPFMKLKARDFVMDPKIGLLVLFTRWLYRINVHKNDCLIVQQEWFADEMSRMLGVPREKFRIIPPKASVPIPASASSAAYSKSKAAVPTFLFVSTPDCHKNFETLCAAAAALEDELGKGVFKVIMTIAGNENRYSRFLYKNWGRCTSLDFHGLVPRSELQSLYSGADCFVFPSRIESWGLPISEYIATHPGGHLLLSNLPYAHATVAASEGSASMASISYFPPVDVCALKNEMKTIINSIV